MESVEWNPAAAASLEGVELGFAYLDQMALVPYAQADLGIRLGGTWGGVLTLRDSGDDALHETSLGVSLARRLGRLSVGATGRLLMATFGRNDLSATDYAVFDPAEVAEALGNQVQGDALGFSLGIGARYAVGRAALGIALRNAVSPITWNSGLSGGGGTGSYSEDLPPELVVGAQIPAGRAGLLRMDYRPATSEDLDPVVRAGAEWVLAEVLALRIGTERYFNGRADDRLTAGFGLLVPAGQRMRISAGYAYADSFLGASQQVALTVRVR